MKNFILFSLISLVALSANGQSIPNSIAIPDGWACVDKKTSDNKPYKICSPPAGKTGTPFFLWKREPIPQAPAK
jgi:hypothetical protein